MEINQKTKNAGYELIHERGHNRCPICGGDVEKLYPFVLEVSKDSLLKIQQVYKNLTIQNTRIVGELDRVFDDMTMRVITGVAFKINLPACFDCIDEIGRLHKFQQKNKVLSYATKQL